MKIPKNGAVLICKWQTYKNPWQKIEWFANINIPDKRKESL